MRINRVGLLLKTKFQCFSLNLIKYIYFSHGYIYSNKMPSF